MIQQDQQLNFNDLVSMFAIQFIYNYNINQNMNYTNFAFHIYFKFNWELHLKTGMFLKIYGLRIFPLTVTGIGRNTTFQ